MKKPPTFGWAAFLREWVALRSRSTPGWIHPKDDNPTRETLAALTSNTVAELVEACPERRRRRPFDRLSPNGLGSD